MLASIAGGGLSGLGLIAQYEDPSLTVIFISAALALVIGVIMHAFWDHARKLVPAATVRFLGMYLALAIVSGAMIFCMSSIGNISAIIVGAVTNLEQDQRIAKITERAGEADTLVRNLATVVEYLVRRRGYLADQQKQEASGKGPSGKNGPGDVSDAYGRAASLLKHPIQTLQDKVSRVDALLGAVNAALAQMRVIRRDRALSGADRVAALESAQDQALAHLRALQALAPVKSLEAVTEMIARGIDMPAKPKPYAVPLLAQIAASLEKDAEYLQEKSEELAKQPLTPLNFTPSTLFDRVWTNLGGFLPYAVSATAIDLFGFILIAFQVLGYADLRGRHDREQKEIKARGGFVVSDRDYANFGNMLETNARFLRAYGNDHTQIAPPTKPINGAGQGERPILDGDD